ncbi:MAG: hypothetical protein CSA74_04345 [Rhodobacterales bacterium]|nr:MAG: hypothetical protein CSA74_04345 [Rhodobacterales bacterium]
MSLRRVTPGWVLLIACIIATLSALVTMRLWTIPALRAATGGLDVFDVLIQGYSPDYVALYLDVLPDAARDLQLGAHRALDTLFVAGFTATLSVASYLLARRWNLVLALSLGVIPLFYFAFEMLENAQVAVILTHPGPHPAMAAAASRFTVLKAQALVFALSAVLFLISARSFELAFAPEEKR